MQFATPADPRIQNVIRKSGIEIAPQLAQQGGFWSQVEMFQAGFHMIQCRVKQLHSNI